MFDKATLREIEEDEQRNDDDFYLQPSFFVSIPVCLLLKLGNFPTLLIMRMRVSPNCHPHSLNSSNEIDLYVPPDAM